MLIKLMHAVNTKIKNTPWTHRFHPGGGGSTFPSNLGDESDGAAVQGGTETYQVLIQSLEIMTGILSPVQHGLVVRGLRV